MEKKSLAVEKNPEPDSGGNKTISGGKETHSGGESTEPSEKGIVVIDVGRDSIEMC